MLWIVKRFASMLAIIFVLSPVWAQVDDNQARLKIVDVALKFSTALPLEKTFVLRSLSPEETGLPEDFLRRLTSDVEAGLLLGTNNRINLKSRQATDELWAEAIEFNSATFEDLYARSSADVMLLVSPRVVEGGVEIALAAYELSGEEIGNAIAASGAVLVALDLKASLGIDVSSIDRKLDSVLEAIETAKPKAKTREEIEQILSGLGARIEWFEKQYDVVAHSVLDLGERRVSKYSIDGCAFEITSVNGEIRQVRMGVRPPLCDFRVGDSLVSQMKFSDLFYLGKGQRQADCVSCGNSYDPTISYVVFGTHAASWMDMKFETYDRHLHEIQGLRDHSDRISFLRHLNSFRSRLRYLIEGESIDYFSTGYLMYEIGVDAGDDVENKDNSEQAGSIKSSNSAGYFDVFPSQDILGGDLTQDGYRGVAIDACADICQKTDGCKSAAWVEATQWCWPKTTAGPTVSKIGVTVILMKSNEPSLSIEQDGGEGSRAEPSATNTPDDAEDAALSRLDCVFDDHSNVEVKQDVARSWMPVQQIHFLDDDSRSSNFENFGIIGEITERSQNRLKLKYVSEMDQESNLRKIRVTYRLTFFPETGLVVGNVDFLGYKTMGPFRGTCTLN